jgi:hypothetical protein
MIRANRSNTTGGSHMVKTGGKTSYDLADDRMGHMDKDDHLKIEGKRLTRIDGSDEIWAGARKLYSDSTILVEAKDGIALKVGSSFILITGDQIVIQAGKILENCGESVPEWASQEPPTEPEPPKGVDKGSIPNGGEMAKPMPPLEPEQQEGEVNIVASAPAQNKSNEDISYNVQIRIIWKDTKEIISNTKYVIKLAKDESILAEGKTNDEGLTIRISTTNQEIVALYYFDIENDLDEIYIGSCQTIAQEDSVVDMERERGRLFFDIHYQLNDNAFKRAAIGYQNRALAAKRFRPELGDIWLSYEIKTESQFVAGWDKIWSFQKKSRMEIYDGRILTHASIGKNTGVDLKPDYDADDVGLKITDGTLNLAEIKSLKPLVWAKGSNLYVHSCRSGIPDLKLGVGISIIEAFSVKQFATYIHGQTGWAYFSLKENKYETIDGYSGTNIHLWAYRRGKNVRFVGPLLDGQWMNPEILEYHGPFKSPEQSFK